MIASLVRGRKRYPNRFYYFCPYCGHVTDSPTRLRLSCPGYLGKDEEGRNVKCPAPEDVDMIVITQDDFLKAMEPFIEG